MQDIEKWCSMEEIAEYLSVSRETILNWIKKRGMPAQKIGRLWKFNMDEVNQWIQNKNKSNAESIQPMPVCLGAIQTSAMYSFANIFMQLHMEGSGNTVDKVKSMLNYLILSLTRSYYSDYTANDIKEMTNEALCYFLLTWLRNAENTKQRSGSFTKRAYTLKENQKELLHITADDTTRKRLERYLVEYYRNLHEADVINDIQRDIPEHTFHDFVALTWAESYPDGLLLYQDLISHQEPLEVQSSRNVICEGYYKYFDNLRLISYEKNDVAFVSKCLTFYEFEMNYRFMFAHQIAEALSVYENVSLTELMDYLGVYYKGILCAEKKYPSTLSTIRYGNKLMEIACTNRLTESHINKIFHGRIIIQIAIDTFLNMMPSIAKRKWTEGDIKAAKKFLLDDYHFDDLIESVNLDYLVDDTDHSREQILKYIYLKQIDSQKLNYFRSKINPAKQENKSEIS